MRILRDVAKALSYAHGRGIVHRDIKPENVLLTHGDALVADFGVAKALSASSASSGEGAAAPTVLLTSVGMALGTPTYMSPEQAAGDPDVDHRADIYALGVLGYELLTGAPPFAGRPAQALLAAHAPETPEPLSRKRPGVPAALTALLMRCLEKRPADRPQTADDVLLELEMMPTSSGSRLAGPGAPWRPRSRVIAAGGALAVAALIIALFARRPLAAGNLDQNLVAVSPFRISGADPSLAYLREGMLDLLAAKLNGEGGPRAVDPRTVLSAWRSAGATAGADVPQRAMLRTAAGLGAGQLLLGGVVGAPGRLVITASLLSVPGGA
ncbi:MAG: serine/threonine-protein kinase, partial [Gemmatimonadaceae bacterium]